MISVKGGLIWEGSKVTKAMRAKMVEVLHEIADELWEYVDTNLSTPAPPHSNPGQFPHEISGDLRTGIIAAVNESDLSLILSSSAPHTIHLELGTHNMEPRPFLRPAIESIKPKMNAILQRVGARKWGYD